MKITITPTQETFGLVSERAGDRGSVPVRVWEGVTEDGIPCRVYVATVAVHKDQPPEAHARFQRELTEFLGETRRELVSFDIRMIS